MTTHSTGSRILAHTRQLLSGALLLLFVMPCRLDAAAAAPVGGPRSEERLTVLRKLVRDFYATNPLDTSEYRVSKDVLAEFEKVDSCPVVPKAKALGMRDYRSETDEETYKLVRKKYPALDEKALEAEAAEKYPIYEQGQKITVTYQPGPGRVLKKTGIYQGRQGDYVLIFPSTRILLRDIARIKDSEAELLKFEPGESTKLRKAYLDERRTTYETKQRDFQKKVRALIMKAVTKRGVERNEENGYIWYEGKWLRLRDALTVVAEQIKADVTKARGEARRQSMLEDERQINVSVMAQATFDIFGGPRFYDDPEKLYAVLQAEEIARAEAEKKRKAAAEAARLKAIADKKAAKEREIKRKEREAAAAAAKAAQAKSDEPQIGKFDKNDSMMMYYIIGAVAVILVGGGVWFFLSKRSAPDPAKFFKAKGKMQKNFWGMAEADPETFKYAAYRFPTMEAARAALLNLSYMRDDHGQVKSKADILYGSYPHQDKAVAFLGGPKLGYAMWREATALWPELPGAEYFRVSTAPEVSLDVPDIQELMADKDINITFVERKEAEDFTMHHIYKAPDENSATTFLEKVEIKSPDVNIIVETPDLIYRKNIDGVITYKPGEEPTPEPPSTFTADAPAPEEGGEAADKEEPDSEAKEGDGDEKKEA